MTVEQVYKRNKRDRVLIGLGYLSLAGLFIVILLITALYIPSAEFRNLNIKDLLDFIFVYQFLNVLMSLYIGIALITLTDIRKSLAKKIIGAGAFLILLDLIPIGQEVSNYIKEGTWQLPWTIILICFHVYLLFSFSMLWKRIRLA